MGHTLALQCKHKATGINGAHNSAHAKDLLHKALKLSFHLIALYSLIKTSCIYLSTLTLAKIDTYKDLHP